MDTKLHLKVSTGKKKFQINWKENEKILYVELKNNPEKGKANKEIIKNLKNIFESEVKIISGFKSKEKIVNINSSEKKIQGIINTLVLNKHYRR